MITLSSQIFTPPKFCKYSKSANIFSIANFHYHSFKLQKQFHNTWFTCYFAFETTFIYFSLRFFSPLPLSLPQFKGATNEVKACGVMNLTALVLFPPQKHLHHSILLSLSLPSCLLADTGLLCHPLPQLIRFPWRWGIILKAGGEFSRTRISNGFFYFREFNQHLHLTKETKETASDWRKVWAEYGFCERICVKAAFTSCFCLKNEFGTCITFLSCPWYMEF